MSVILEKQPEESILYQFDYSNSLASGEVITDEGTVAQVNKGIISGSSDLTIAAPINNSTNIVVRISGGTDKEKYKLTALVTTSLSNILELDAVMHVRDE